MTAIHSGAQMPPFDTRMSRAEAVARIVEEAIADGSIQAGERLGTKDDLRRRYGVAAGTLNEAIRLLHDRGLVEARPGPGGGLFATAPSPSARMGQLVPGFREGGATAADSLVVRNALEPLIVTDAVAHATPAAVEELRAIVGRMAELRGEPAEYLRANWELHRRIAAISPNSVLASAYLTVLNFAEEMLERSGEDAGEPVSRQNLQVHRELVEAIADGDSQRATRAIRRHEPLTAELSVRA